MTKQELFNLQTKCDDTHHLFLNNEIEVIVKLYNENNSFILNNDISIISLVFTFFFKEFSSEIYDLITNYTESFNNLSYIISAYPNKDLKFITDMIKDSDKDYIYIILEYLAHLNNIIDYGNHIKIFNIYTRFINNNITINKILGIIYTNNLTRYTKFDLFGMFNAMNELVEEKLNDKKANI